MSATTTTPRRATGVPWGVAAILIAATLHVGVAWAHAHPEPDSKPTTTTCGQQAP